MASARVTLSPRPTELLRAPPVVGEVLRSTGQALNDDTRVRMEQRLGSNFSQVRVHTDARAAQSAAAVDALAYTVGRDIVFGEGRYAPHSASGQRLLAHELAHVVQQRGAAHDAHEAAADWTAQAALPGGAATSPMPATAGAVLQRQPVPAGTPQVVPTLNLPTAGIELAADEAISADNPKLVDLASSFRRADGAGSSARIAISAALSEGAKLSSAGEQAERSRLSGRMLRIRDALAALGVPKERIDLSAPTAYSTSARGQVSVDVRKSAGGLLPLFQGSSPALGPTAVPPAPASTSPSLSDLLTLKFGPVTVELPKSIKAKLPIPISTAKSLVIELQADAPAKFAFKLTLDGTPYVRVSASAGAEYDTDKKIATGSAGLQIESVKTTCHATNPEETRSKITSAGDKLMKASAEYSAATDAETKQGKLIDIAGAIGEMYNAVDKAKAACKQVPRWKLEFGVKGPLGSGGSSGSDADTDPSKRPPTVLGGTLTIPF